MKIFNVAVLAGDGIGEEVMRETLRVLRALEVQHDIQFNFHEAKIGGAAFDVYGKHCPEETLRISESSDAILFGSVGGSVSEQHLPKWKDCETNSILKLRQHFQFNTNLRPIHIHREFPHFSPLKKEILGDGLDVLIVRELTGGLYFGRHDEINDGQERVATDECVYREKQISDIAHVAFRCAQSRKKNLCSVDKANVLSTSKLWRAVFSDVAQAYPDVSLTHMLVDNCAMQLVLNPHQFDVIVTENMFGDILSDLGAALTGSLGMVPSASLNAAGLGLYEPSGGSAPDLAGKGIANPCAQLLSAAMMLQHSFGLHEVASQIEKAIKKTVHLGFVTPDLMCDGKTVVSTTQFVDHVILGMQS